MSSAELARGSDGNALRSSLHAIHLILTSSCDLCCEYCYRPRRSGQWMSEAVLCRTLDWALELGDPALRCIFSGGEPLLAMPRIRRAIDHLADRRPSGPRPALVVQTNGLRLDESALATFGASGVDVHLSFDGVPGAQARRDRGSILQLERLLRRIGSGSSELPREKLTVLMTVSPDTVGFLSDSFDSVLSMGIQNISISPEHVPPMERPDACDAILLSQLDRIRELCLARFRDSGRIVFTRFHGDLGPASHPWRTRPMCGVVQGRSVAVDVDGSIYGCPMLAADIVRQGRPWLAPMVAGLLLGRISAAGAEFALERFLERARRTPILNAKERKRSGASHCMTCDAIGDCDLCPVTIGLIPGNDDPDRVPDFACAFQRATFRAKRRFLAEVAGISSPFRVVRRD